MYYIFYDENGLRFNKVLKSTSSLITFAPIKFKLIIKIDVRYRKYHKLVYYMFYDENGVCFNKALKSTSSLITFAPIKFKLIIKINVRYRKYHTRMPTNALKILTIDK